MGRPLRACMDEPGRRAKPHYICAWLAAGSIFVADSVNSAHHRSGYCVGPPARSLECISDRRRSDCPRRNCARQARIGPEGRRLATKGTKSTKGRIKVRGFPFVLFVPFVANLLPSPLGFYLPISRMVNDPGTTGAWPPRPPAGGAAGAGPRSWLIVKRCWVLLSNVI